MPPAKAASGQYLAPGLLLFVVIAKLGILALAGERYGYLSDELYFLEAGRYLAAGYVDFPPLIAWLCAALAAVGLDSILSLRVVAALLGIAVSLVAVDLCRWLGGSTLAQWLTALVVVLAPGFLSVQSMLTMNSLDQLWWMLSFWATARFVVSGNDNNLLLLGCALGFGLLSKLSILALCAALPLAFLVWSPDAYRRPRFWYAGILALALTTPYVIWQIVNDYPLVDFVSAYNSTPPKAMVLQNPVLGMLLTMNPGYTLFWGIGALYCLVARSKALRLLGTAAWLCLALFVLAGVKFYFAVPVFGLFTIAGALFWERFSAQRWTFAIRALLVTVAVSGVLSVPAAAPVLSRAQLQQLANFIRDGEQGFVSQTPAELERYFPHFAEMHGWPELVEKTADAWESLAPEQRHDALLFGSFYGHTAALNRLDTDDRLPEAYGRHMNYNLWSKNLDYAQGLFVGFDAAELEALFERVEEVAELDCDLCMSRDNGLRIHFVEGPQFSPADIHERLRRYYFF